MANAKKIHSSRFGRGIGLELIRRVGEWRPSREGRQEVIKVKVFEGQNVEFRAPVAGCGDRDNGAAPVTLTGDVIVATITPDKLVRFWTSTGMPLGNLDQVGFVTHATVEALRYTPFWRKRFRNHGAS